MQDTCWEVESYPFAEKQSVYSTAAADWARITWFGLVSLFNGKSTLLEEQ